MSLMTIVTIITHREHDRDNDYNNRRDNHHDDKDVNAQNNAFILDEEDKAKEQRDIKEHYSNDDVHNGSHDLQITMITIVMTINVTVLI